MSPFAAELCVSSRDFEPTCDFTWQSIPGPMRAALATKGYGEAWFAERALPDRATVVVLYLKLRHLGLWQHVGTEMCTTVGRLEFCARDVEKLQATLASRPDFTTPRQSPAPWSSRERRAHGALHFRHCAGWPDDRVQAHVDPIGLWLSSGRWWLLPLVPIAQMLRHAWDRKGCENIERVFSLVVAQDVNLTPIPALVPGG